MENNVHTQEFVVEAEQAGERLERYLTLIYAKQSKLLSKADQSWECQCQRKSSYKSRICLRCI